MADDCSHPSFKKARLEIGRTKSRHQNFQQVHKQLFNHKDLICEAIEQLESDWAGFCFVKILFCNADESCSFSRAYCKTIRNVQEKTPEKRRIVWIPDLFDVALVKSFLNNSEDIEDQVLDKQLTAFEKLARIFNNIEDTNKILQKELRDESLKEGRWAFILGTHLLRKLAVYDDMKIDSGYSDLSRECPCGCKTPINIGDNSMGHEDVWHGSVDILLGPTCIEVFTTKPKDEDEFTESSNSTFELKRGKLESSQNRLISESITFAFAMRGGVVPLIGISKTYFSIYMYDPDGDLLYESSSMPLFIDSVDGRQLHLTSLIALWIVVNHSYFFKGVQSSHVDFGYKANLQKFLGEEQRDIYQNHTRMGGLRHVSSNVVEFKAGMNKGKFKRL